MKLTREEVQRVAMLARLRLTPEDEERLTEQLGNILQYVGKRDIAMQFLFGLGDLPKNGLYEILRRKFPLAEFFPGFMEREYSKIHSMILGT